MTLNSNTPKIFLPHKYKYKGLQLIQKEISLTPHYTQRDFSLTKTNKPKPTTNCGTKGPLTN